MALSPDERDYVNELAYNNQQALLHEMDAYTAPPFEHLRNAVAHQFYRLSHKLFDLSRSCNRAGDQIGTSPF